MISVILLMAGKGTRLNAGMNKVLLELDNKPIYKYSLDLFKDFKFEIICVISLEDKEIIDHLPEGVLYTYGGTTRQESVYNGLLKAKGDYIIIHDAARPLLNEDVVKDIICQRNKNEAILTYLLPKDTIKQMDNGIIKTLDRSKLLLATTPQCASRSVLLDAYKKALDDNFIATDDISIIENYRKDIRIRLVKSNEENFKITTSIDLALANTILKNR